MGINTLIQKYTVGGSKQTPTQNTHILSPGINDVNEANRDCGVIDKYNEPCGTFKSMFMLMFIVCTAILFYMCAWYIRIAESELGQFLRLFMLDVCLHQGTICRLASELTRTHHRHCGANAMTRGPKTIVN